MRKPISTPPSPVLKAMKRKLESTMKAKKLSNVKLAKRLGTVEGTVRRMVDPSRNTHVGTVEKTLHELGIETRVSFGRIGDSG